MSEPLHKWEIPDSWAWTSMGDIAEVVGGGTPPTADIDNFKDGEIPWITPADLSGYTNKFISSGARNITQYGLDNSGAHLVPAGTVLFSSRAPIGYVAIAANQLSTNQGFKSFVLYGGIKSDYIYYYLKRARDFAIELASGTTFLEISGEKAKLIPVSIPPLAEQQRIVEEIEKQFSRLDAAVEILQRVERNLERLRTTTLKAAVEGRLVPTEAELVRAGGRDYEPADVLLQRILRERRAKWEADQLAKMKEQGKTPKDNKWKDKYKEPVLPEAGILPELPKGWTWATVDQLVSFEPNSLTDGPFGSNLKTSDYTTSGPRVIRLQNIGDGYFIDEHAYISEEHFEALQKHQIFAGDIVIASLGEIAPRACIIPAFVGNAIVKADCIRFKPNSDIAVTEYINYALNSEPTRKRTTSFIHGVGRPRLGLGGIREIALPLPPVVEQLRVVAEVERRISVIEELRTLVTNAVRRASILRQKILRHAFAGKLVPQDPTDEPASLLLERIRAEKAEREVKAEQARKERRKTMKGSTPKTTKRKPRRPLRETIADLNQRLTPEQLFTEAGFTFEVVEDFYEELRHEINAGHIKQVRPDNAKIYLIAASA